MMNPMMFARNAPSARSEGQLPIIRREWRRTRQAVSASGQSKTPKCSQASIRAVAASRVLASRRRSWVRSQVSRARRERADGSLSKSAGNRPSASTNSRIAAVQGAFGAGVSSNFSQVTQRLASPARVMPRLVRRRDSPSAKRVGEIAVALDGGFVGGDRRAGVGQNGAQQIARAAGQAIRPGIAGTVLRPVATS